MTDNIDVKEQRYTILDYRPVCMFPSVLNRYSQYCSGTIDFTYLIYGTEQNSVETTSVFISFRVLNFDSLYSDF